MQPKQAIGVCIRYMVARDMTQILKIEQKSFEFAWVEKDFLDYLRQRNSNGFVVEYDTRIIGYMVYELHKPRLHILNFAVQSDYRRQTVGQQMADKLKEKSSAQHRKEIVLEVRETNLAAQHFFYKQGFRAKRVLRGHYADSAEDAYQMVYTLGETSEDVAGHISQNRLHSY
ncbi:MAG: ribosomal protein S18-alanine N-acetyltransferase [Candidatus Sungbacteria bacterium]|nr:ribosomal protein S18-alanine N-acetyltransferase [Candidatus Sungbacteria bacterium]